MIELEYRIQVMDNAVVHHSLTCSWASSFAQPVLEQNPFFLSEIRNYYFPLKVLHLTCRVKKSTSLSIPLGMCFVPYLMYFLVQLAIDGKILLCFCFWTGLQVNWGDWSKSVAWGFQASPWLQTLLSHSPSYSCLPLTPRLSFDALGFHQTLALLLSSNLSEV